MVELNGSIAEGMDSIGNAAEASGFEVHTYEVGVPAQDDADSVYRSPESPDQAVESVREELDPRVIVEPLNYDSDEYPDAKVRVEYRGDNTVGVSPRTNISDPEVAAEFAAILQERGFEIED